jgi:FtsH-binding integral membrane protein
MDTRNNPIVIDGRNDSRGVAQSVTASSLLSKVLVIASLGFFVSAVGVYLAPPTLGGGVIFLSFLVTLGLIFSIQATRKSPLVAFGLFMLLALAMGFALSPYINHLLHLGQSKAIFNAALTTAVGMACLGMGAQIFTFDYRRVGSYAGAALLALIIVGVLGMFFRFISPGLYAYLTLIIFSVLVVVDFMRIRNGGDGATAVELALSIYLDGINIFLALTRIFSGNRD